MCTLILYNLPACQQPLLIQTQYVTHSRGPIFLSVFYTLNELVFTPRKIAILASAQYLLTLYFDETLQLCQLLILTSILILY